MEDKRTAFLLELAGRTLYGEAYARELARAFGLPLSVMEQILDTKCPPTPEQVRLICRELRHRGAGLEAIADELEKMAGVPQARRTAAGAKLRTLLPSNAALGATKAGALIGSSGRIRTLARRNERALMRGAVALFAAFSLATYVWVDRLNQQLDRATAALELPRVNSTVIPGIPAALAETWHKASGGRTSDPRTETWLTARIENVGFEPIGHLVVDVSADAEIREVFAATPTGRVIGDAWLAPEVIDGGKGRRTVSVKFPNLPPATGHWLFLGLDSPAIVTSANAAAALTLPLDPRVHLKTLTVTATDLNFSAHPVTSTSFGWAPNDTVAPVAAKPSKGSG
jgi:hypothetical protein